MGGRSDPVRKNRNAQWKPKSVVYAVWKTAEWNDGVSYAASSKYDAYRQIVQHLEQPPWCALVGYTLPTHGVRGLWDK